MTARPIPLAPAELAQRLAEKRALLVDIREPDEYRRRHVPGALSRPLSGLVAAGLARQPKQDVVFTCKSGARTAAACERLAAAVDGPVLVLEGGLDAWAAAGLPIAEDKMQPIELLRQVQIAAGSLVAAGVALGLLIHPAFLGLSAFVGAGLIVAGVTGTCGMARLLSLAPWNRAARRRTA